MLSMMVSRMLKSRVLFCHSSEHGVSGVSVGAVGSSSGGVECQQRQAGSDAWGMVLASHLSSGRVVSGASENERLVNWTVGSAESNKAEAAGSKAAGAFGSASRRANRRCASDRGGKVGPAGTNERSCR